MKIKNKKYIILTFLFTLSANLFFNPSLADDDKFLYSSKLRKIDISNQLNNNFIINIHSDKKINQPINIKQTSDKSFIITIPESFLLDDTLIYTFSKNNFFSSKIQYFPYLSNNDSYGYTNIYINTIKPIDFDKFNILNTYYKEINSTDNLALSKKDNKTNAIIEKNDISKNNATKVIVNNSNNIEKNLKITKNLSLNNSDKIIQKKSLNYKQKNDIIKKDSISLEQNNLKKNSNDKLILEEKNYKHNKIEEEKNLIDINNKNFYIILYLLPILILLILFRKLKITNKIIESMKIMETENKVINLESFFDIIVNSTEESHIYNFIDELAEKNRKEEQEKSKDSSSNKIDESSLPELQLNDCNEIVIINKNESSRFNNLSNEDDEDNPIELDLDKEYIDDLLPDEIIDTFNNNLIEEPTIDIDKEILDNFNINQDFLNKDTIINKDEVNIQENEFTEFIEDSSLDNEQEFNKKISPSSDNDSHFDNYTKPLGAPVESDLDLSFEDSKPLIIDEDKINALESEIEQNINQEIQKVNDYIQSNKNTAALSQQQEQQNIENNNVTEFIEDSSLDNEQEFNKDNLNLIYSQELSDNKFLYLINYTDTNALIGEVNGNISVIKRFENITNPIIKARIQDKNINKETYIVKTNGARLLIESNDSNMNLLMEL